MHTDDPMRDYLQLHPEWSQHADLVIAPPLAEEVVDEFPDAEHAEVLQHANTWMAHGVTRLAMYVRLRRDGKSHRLAEMLALQRPPRCMTDDVFFQGMPRLGDALGERQLQNVVRAAKRHGFTPPADAVYHSGLARFQGDPEAFVTRAMGRTYIRRLCERRGWSCEGGVNVAGREPERDPHDPQACTPLAADLVRANAQRMIARNPDLKHMPRKQLREMVLQKYGPST